MNATLENAIKLNEIAIKLFDKSLLDFAVESGNYQLCKDLLEYKINVTNQMLLSCCLTGNVDVLKLLLDYICYKDSTSLSNRLREPP